MAAANLVTVLRCAAATSQVFMYWEVHPASAPRDALPSAMDVYNLRVKLEELSSSWKLDADAAMSIHLWVHGPGRENVLHYQEFRPAQGEDPGQVCYLYSRCPVRPHADPRAVVSASAHGVLRQLASPYCAFCRRSCWWFLRHGCCSACLPGVALCIGTLRSVRASPSCAP
jgi:hypothetical protein